MPVTQVPGFWDYLGQAFSVGAGSANDVIDRKRREEHLRTAEEQAQIQQILNAVQSGLMDSGTANALPLMQKSGMTAAITPQEVARRLMRQGPVMTPTIDVNKYVAGPAWSSLANVTGVESKPAGTPEERSFANLPSAGAMAGDELNATLSRLKNQYFATANPEQITAGIGGTTVEDLEMKKRKDLDPIVSAAADRYIDQMVNEANLDLMDSKILRRNAVVLSNKAFDQYMKDSGAAGNMISKSPQDIAYAKTFFASAMSNLVKESDAAAQKLAYARTQSGGNQDKSIQLYNALTATADDFDRQAAAALKIINDPIAMATNGMDRATLESQVQQFTGRAREYRRNALKALTGKLDSSTLEKLGIDVPVPTGVKAHGETIPDFTPEEFSQAVQIMRQVPPDKRAAEFEARRGVMSAADYVKMKKELGL